MTKQAPPLPGQPENPQPPSAAGPESAGAQLRRMRQAAGMDVGVLAAALKVPVHKIEALEEGRLEQFPNLTFARGLAGAICRTLRTDAVPVLACMPAIVAELRERDTSIDQPFRRSEEGLAPMITSRPSRPLMILVVVVLLGVALLALWPALPVQPGASEPEAADEERQDHAGAPPLSAPSFVQERTPASAASQAEAQGTLAFAPAGDASDSAAAMSASAPAAAASAAASAAARNAAASVPVRTRPASAPVRRVPASVPASAPQT